MPQKGLLSSGVKMRPRFDCIFGRKGNLTSGHIVLFGESAGNRLLN